MWVGRYGFWLIPATHSPLPGGRGRAVGIFHRVGPRQTQEKRQKQAKKKPSIKLGF
jgi:hypothetical protein